MQHRIDVGEALSGGRDAILHDLFAQRVVVERAIEIVGQRADVLQTRGIAPKEVRIYGLGVVVLLVG